MQAVSTSRASPRLLFGCLVIAAGVLLTLDNMGVIRIRHAWDYWPGLFVVMGLVMAAQSRGSRRTLGLVIAFVSALLLLDNLDAIDFDLWDLWPLGLVLIGLALVWNSLTKSRRAAPPDSGVRVFSLFSNTRRAVTAADFRGAELSAFFGSCEVDLRTASLAGQATLDVAAVFGSIYVRVPLDWTVSVDGGFVGGIDVETQPPPAPGKLLRVHGFAPLANVKITN